MDLLDFFKRVGTGEETTVLTPSLPYELTNYYFFKDMDLYLAEKETKRQEINASVVL